MTVDRREQLLRACRVPARYTDTERELWRIRRIPITGELVKVLAKAKHLTERMEFRGMWVDGAHTTLERLTLASMMADRGEVVMEDSRRELARHLPILLRGTGRILVSGLGLGCVVRGLLSKPEVTHVDVVELDRTILELVGPEFAENPRVSLHHGDALTVAWSSGTRWDYAWHDIWSEEESLSLLHAHLLARYDGMVEHQGAWQFPREYRRIWPGELVA